MEEKDKFKKNNGREKSPFACDYYRMTGKKLRKGVPGICDFLFHYFGEFRIRYMYYVRWLSAHSRRNPLYPVFYAAKIILGRRRGLEISEKARIGPGLYLGHPYNITVSGGCNRTQCQSP